MGSASLAQYPDFDISAKDRTAFRTGILDIGARVFGLENQFYWTPMCRKCAAESIDTRCLGCAQAVASDAISLPISTR